MKFTTSTLTALSLIVYQAHNIVIAQGQISCSSVYEPVRCGNNKQDWFSNDCLAIQGGYKNPDKDCHEVICEEYDQIVNLLEDEFGSKNCGFTTHYPMGPEDAVTWHFCRDEKTGVDIQFEAVGLNSPYPRNINVVYDNGDSSEITLHDDCNDFDRVSDFLRDIERPPQDDCNQLTDVISLMEEKFGQENCDEFSAFPQGLTVTCSIKDGTGRGTITAKLNAPYNEDDIATPSDITLIYGGGIVGNQPIVEFSNDCTGDDLMNVQDLLKNIERPPQDDCNQLTEIRSLMEEKFGQENCDEFSAFPESFTVTCTIKDGIGRGTITAKLNAPYNKDDIATPNDITLRYGGGIVGTIPVVEFSNDCTGDDLQNVQDLLKDIERR